ncbi:MAG: 30S ribosomal protein S15 [Methylacidiphilales bacterium]|nr:30S ribosomal protein S15 [Candidatus Methylacidiphilales bacterium]
MQFSKESLVKEYSGNSKNTGLSEVQIAICSEHIKSLVSHFEKHPKDNHSKNGLFKLIQRRKKLLKYLKRADHVRFTSIVKKLQIRG